MEKMIVSACLVGCACRYDGKAMPNPLLKAMFEAGELIAVCPEILGGLPTPRDPAEIVSEDPVRLSTNQGADVTAAYQCGAAQGVAVAEAIDAKLAILKSKSPSCGSQQIYDGSFQGRLIPGAGVTARAMRAAGITVINEEQAESRFASDCTRIVMVRHADSIFSSDDRGRGLSPEGEKAAEVLAESLKDQFEVDQIYSSPYLRAMDTVKPLAQAWKLDIVQDERLRERKVSDTTVEDFASFAAKQWLDHRFALPGGESLDETANRGIEFLQEIEADNRGKTILLSTHGTWMGAVLHLFDSAFGYRDWHSLQMPDCWEMIFYHGRWVEAKQHAFCSNIVIK